MPNCFQLVRKTDPEASPVVFTTIDTEMCRHFNVKCDPVEWHHGWYDIIGLSLAYGKTFDQLKETYIGYIREAEDAWDIHMLDIINWLDANFVSDAWAEVGRRK